MTMTPKRLKIAGWCAALFMLAGVASVITAAVRNGFDLSHTPLTNHTSLFTDSVRNELPQAFVFKSKIRGATSNYVLPDGFHLTVYEIALKDNKPLDKLLRINDRKPEKTHEVFSTAIDNQAVTMTQSANAVGAVSDVNLRCDGALTKSLVKGDSIACYHLRYNKFSVSYDTEGNDIWGITHNATPRTISLAFIKQAKVLYLVMLFKTDVKAGNFVPAKLLSMLDL